MKKQLRSRQELGDIILGATWLMKHTRDDNAKENYHLMVQTAAQDYYVVVGSWYRCSSTLQKTITGGRG